MQAAVQAAIKDHKGCVQEASIPIVSNLIDNTDRSSVPNELFTLN